jgi:hypothetical protein
MKIVTTKSIVQIAFIVLFSCFFLFYIDFETKSVTDLFKLGNLFALILYFIPTFIICLLLYQLILMKTKTKKSLFWALIMGIPISFTIVVFILYQSMHQ